MSTNTPLLHLLLIRHGESEANSEWRMQGRLDSPLTPRGCQQAEAIAARVASEGRVDVVYSSPLRRALETAQTIGRWTAAETVVLPDLINVDIGKATGISWTEFSARWPREAQALREGRPDAAWPGGESRAQLALRAARAMDEITMRHQSGTVVVVSHEGNLRWSVAHLMRGTSLAHPGHRFSNCAITEVVLGKGGPLISYANDASHLVAVEEKETRSS